MSEFGDKVRSIGFARHKGRTRTRIIRREDNGRIAGKEIDHWNDRTDAVALPGTARLHIRNEEE